MLWEFINCLQLIQLFNYSTFSLSNYSIQMAHIFMPDIVLYQCSCGSQRPVTKIYYCRHCCQLRCGECSAHEVDSHYCQNCLEYMPSPEARVKKNKCANCFDCPRCMHTLSARATSILMPSTDDPEKMVPKKVYYMVCGYCRWTSRDVGIPDQTAVTGNWQEKENIHSERIHVLLEHYLDIAQEEKLERDKKKPKPTQRTSYLHYNDKYGIANVIGKKLSGLHPIPVQSKKKEPTLPISEASADAEVLPDKYYTEPLNLATICTLEQRLFQPHYQPVMTSELYPKRKYLLIKRSRRCKTCQHNICKPEYNPASIKFKLQLSAFCHIPDLRIRSKPILLKDKECKVEVTLCNPTPHVVRLSFLPSENCGDSNLSEVILPTCEFTLSGRDDTAEFDDSIDLQQQQLNDPKIVTFRKANKIGLILHVIPKFEEVSVVFQLKHNFINTVVQVQGSPREPQEIWLTEVIRLNLGGIVSTQE